MLLWIGPSPQPAHALTPLRVGKGFPGVFDFVPVDIGEHIHIWKKHGLDLKVFNFNGSAKLHQGLAADAIDIGLGSGPGMAFIVRGSPVKAVAAFMGPPADLVLFVRNEPSIHSVADLKGKTFSNATVGSLTNWLLIEFSRHEGWGRSGIRIVHLGSATAQLSAMRSKQTDGMVTELARAAVFHAKGYGKTMVDFSDVVPNFITHVIYARDRLIKDDPNAIRAFLAGWFETTSWMKKHKAETVKVAAQAMHQPVAIVNANYDAVMRYFSDTGKFHARALATLRRSWLELGLLKKAPDMSKLYTERFLPRAGKARGSSR